MLATSLPAILTLPRSEQSAALRALRCALPPTATPEAWNSRFGPTSLFAAWTASSLMRGLHRSNAELLRPLLARPGFRVIEIGGGDGALWRDALPPDALPPDAQGELLLIDPVAEVGELVRASLPEGVSLRFRQARLEEVDPGSLPPADAFVASLVLHHIAGADRAQRQAHGLSGPGKLEALQTLAGCLRPGGFGLVNEADIHCDIELAPGEPLLEERLIDSYVRRCAPSLLQDAARRPDADADLRARWEAVCLHWCLEQVDLANAPLADRDVYELDVPRWRALFRRAGLAVQAEQFTDPQNLFRQYLLTPSEPR